MGVIKEITTMDDNSDIFQCFAGAVGVSSVGPATGVFESEDWMGGQMLFRDPIVLDADQGDFMEILIQDDLQLIGFLRASAQMKTVLNV